MCYIRSCVMPTVGLDRDSGHARPRSLMTRPTNRPATRPDIIKRREALEAEAEGVVGGVVGPGEARASAGHDARGTDGARGHLGYI